MTVVITGHEGFIGSNLAKRFDHYIGIEKQDCFDKLKTINWYDVRHVYHMGAITDTIYRDVDEMHRYNVHFTIELFRKANAHGIPITYASSASVYGNSNSYAINPLNYYAMSKAQVDLVAQELMPHYSESIVGLRFFNVYGNGEDHKKDQASPITKFTKQAIETGVIKVFDKPSFRDFVWVEDVIDCILTEKKSGIYDVGTSKPISFMKVAEFIAEKYNANIEVISFPDKLKNQYQTNTCAQQHFDKKFTGVRDYVKEKL